MHSPCTNSWQMATLGGNVRHGWAGLFVEVVGGSSGDVRGQLAWEEVCKSVEWRGEGAGNEWGCGSAWLGWAVAIVRRCSI